MRDGNLKKMTQAETLAMKNISKNNSYNGLTYIYLRKRLVNLKSQQKLSKMKPKRGLGENDKRNEHLKSMEQYQVVLI